MNVCFRQLRSRELISMPDLALAEAWSLPDASAPARAVRAMMASGEVRAGPKAL